MNAHIDENKTVNKVLEPIYKFLYVDGVDEITINKPNEIWVKYGYKWVKEDIELSYDQIYRIISAICSRNKMPVRSNNSLILPNGERCQATISPAIVDGYISFNVRKHSSRIYTLDELVNQDAFSSWRDVSYYQDDKSLAEYEKQLSHDDLTLLDLKHKREIKEFLTQCVLMKKNILIGGATGSGKTTFMKSLVQLIPDNERIITIEDVHELHINQPNHLHLLFGDGEGRLPPDQALKACMRLSPDRILLAELRGNEAWEFINSLNTGHSGGMTTVHANNALGCFDRVATLIKNSDVGRGLELETIQRTLINSIDVVLYFKYRKLTEVYFDPIKNIASNVIH